MLHQELVRAATVLVLLLFALSYFMKPYREANQLKRDCGIVVEPDKITDSMRQECEKYLRDVQKYRY